MKQLKTENNMRIQHNLLLAPITYCLLLLACSCQAAETYETLKIGNKSYRNVRVVAATPADVTIIFDGGGAAIKRQELPSPLKEEYPYDADEVTRFQKQTSEYRNSPEFRQKAVDAEESSRRHREVTTAGARTALRRKEEETRASIRGLGNQLELVKAQIVVLDNSGRGRPKARRRYLAAADQARQQRLQLLKQIQQQEDLLRATRMQLDKLP